MAGQISREKRGIYSWICRSKSFRFDNEFLYLQEQELIILFGQLFPAVQKVIGEIVVKIIR